MNTTRVAIHLKLNHPKLYRFGYAETDKVENVTNWQVGNNIFQEVADGDKFFFAENLYIDDAPILKLKYNVQCGIGELELLSVTERRITANPLETDWVNDVTVEDGVVINPFERDWTDDVTIETGAVLEIQSVTERLILKPLETDWVNEITIESDLELLTVTESKYNDFNLDFNNDFNT